jgi:hypothetical protein
VTSAFGQAIELSAERCGRCGNSGDAGPRLEDNEDVKSDSSISQDQLEKYLAEHPYGYQDASGVDLTLILANLRMTPDERVRQAQQAAQQLARMLDVRSS